jgi:hypothetical protein
MLLYLDDDSNAIVLVKLLQKAGHDVQIPADAGISGVEDPEHLNPCHSDGPSFAVTQP